MSNSKPVSGDDVTIDYGRGERRGTVEQTINDEKGQGIVVKLDRGDYKTVSPEQVVEVHSDG